MESSECEFHHGNGVSIPALTDIAIKSLMTACQGVFYVSFLRNDIQKHRDPNFALEYCFTTTQRKELTIVNH